MHCRAYRQLQRIPMNLLVESSGNSLNLTIYFSERYVIQRGVVSSSGRVYSALQAEQARPLADS